MFKIDVLVTQRHKILSCPVGLYTSSEKSKESLLNSMVSLARKTAVDFQCHKHQGKHIKGNTKEHTKAGGIIF